ncbi:mannose-1-phosphate guanylyltransferase [Petroclostridium xylanilyticum]|uniref:mannose-1-phosphate guanylyltransferase n=1 Tax=Petroclostridium xylanilyticum TaxID=1792311 RepID=UPI000B98F5FD|nr:mannose-1-phosphate guanylyltransferase [Petroclostridium xylanilyticum]
MNRYAVIMAGGGGTRFWPLSRQTTPKQVLNISGNDVMINETIKRYDGIIPFEHSFIVTNQVQEKLIKDVLLEYVPHDNILVEPAARNTAPCIIYAALVLMKKYGDGVMCVFPSDHYITDGQGFTNILEKAAVLAEQTDKLITIGIKPTFPSTGYGYINFNKYKPYGEDVFEVLEFVEKPNFDKAKQYIASGNYLWNSGMFVWKVSVIIENFKRFLPRIYDRIREFTEFIGTDKEKEVLEQIYPTLQNISIDFGIMERSNEVLVIPGDFGWNDVGSWDALGAIFPPDENGNIVRADYVGVDTKNCIVYGSGRLIATVGLENMIIVNTDDALLVCPKDKAQDVKKIVDRLKEEKRTEYL